MRVTRLSKHLLTACLIGYFFYQYAFALSVFVTQKKLCFYSSGCVTDSIIVPLPLLCASSSSYLILPSPLILFF